MILPANMVKNQSRTTDRFNSMLSHIVLTDQQKGEALSAAISRKRQETKNQFATLDEVEQSECLYYARYKEEGRLNEIAYWKKVFPGQDQVKYQPTADQLKRRILGGNPDFKPDQEQDNVLDLLCYFFTSDPLLEYYGYSRSKGLCLVGPMGTGKTRIMKMLREVLKSFSLFDCMAITRMFNAKGDESIDDYVKNYASTDKNVCFDDLGAENPGRHYGEVKNVMGEILTIRYIQGNHYRTFITSNLSADDIEQMYGSRVRERIKEMCNWIVIPPTAKSHRK